MCPLCHLAVSPLVPENQAVTSQLAQGSVFGFWVTDRVLKAIAAIGLNKEEVPAPGRQAEGQGQKTHDVGGKYGALHYIHHAV
jgi:hypothetical protein